MVALVVVLLVVVVVVVEVSFETCNLASSPYAHIYMLYMLLLPFNSFCLFARPFHQEDSTSHTVGQECLTVVCVPFIFKFKRYS